MTTFIMTKLEYSQCEILAFHISKSETDWLKTFCFIDKVELNKLSKKFLNCKSKLEMNS